ncbi:MAG: ABC transporter ATP-binding protein [Actinobacteria bacterium]|nr:ABC transporter ATP-binding protein [Actinomycetota bacterium]
MLAVDGLSVDLGGRRVVDDVSFQVAHGEWVALIGPNGAGKSTLLRALGGLVRYEGSIAVEGEEVRSLRRREVARRLALVPQAPLLPPDMHVREYVLLGRTPYVGTFGIESGGDLSAVAHALARLDLVGLADRPLRTLSGGEQQRAVLARAFAQQAPLLLLDEPTTSLDIGRQQQVLELVSELRDEITVVSAMHELTLATQYGDRLLLLAGGRLVADGPPAEVADQALLAHHYGADVRVLAEDGVPIAVVPVRRR